MRELWSRLVALWRAVRVIHWWCQFCGENNATPQLLWPSLRFTLHCQACGIVQAYTTHLEQFDPLPPPWSRRGKAR